MQFSLREQRYLENLYDGKTLDALNDLRQEYRRYPVPHECMNSAGSSPCSLWIPEIDFMWNDAYDGPTDHTRLEVALQNSPTVVFFPGALWSAVRRRYVVSRNGKGLVKVW